MNWILVAAIYGGLAVVAGAFGAHGLKGRLDPSQLETWSTGADYHLVHSLVLLALGLFQQSSGRSVTLQASLFALGILLFSGSLYVLAFGSVRGIVWCTPIGGVLLIAGWGALLGLARQ